MHSQDQIAAGCAECSDAKAFMLKMHQQAIAQHGPRALIQPTLRCPHCRCIVSWPVSTIDVASDLKGGLD